MSRYRCDLCCHRSKNHKDYDFCNSHKQKISKEDIEPPDFCYVWQYHKNEIKNEIRIRWFKNGKLI